MVAVPVVAHEFGVYVHIPFCATRCDYCDFATWTDRAHLFDEYVDACVDDLGARIGTVPPATSVFFGGGTPSLLPADRLLRILAAIPRADDAEVTVECNPDSVDAAKLAAYRAAGVTRVSFGVQSMRAPVLAALGRTHDPANVERAVGWARQAGLTTFNLDLIFGTPGETLDDWRASLDAVLALDPPHVSAYALTVEPATPLGRRVAAGAAAPDDDDQATKYEIADERFAAAGLEWYEVSNWARPGHECRHNLLYWAQGEYLAVGCAAHGHTPEERSPYQSANPGGGASTDQGAPEERSPYQSANPGGGASPDDGPVARRWWNVRTPERYVERIRAGRSPEAGAEHLDPAARAEEALTLALRTRRGVPVPPGAGALVEDLRAAGLLELHPGADGPRAVLTRRGRLLGGDVTARLLLAGPGAGTRYTRVPAAASTRDQSRDRGREPGDRGLFFAAARADTTGAGA